MENIRYRVGLGEKALYCHDRMVGDWPLVRQFLGIFNCAMNKEARV